MATYRLDVSYPYANYCPEADRAVQDAVGAAAGGSGAGFGLRDMEFYFDSAEAMEAARVKFLAASLPFPVEIWANSW